MIFHCFVFCHCLCFCYGISFRSTWYVYYGCDYFELWAALRILSLKILSGSRKATHTVSIAIEWSKTVNTHSYTAHVIENVPREIFSPFFDFELTFNAYLSYCLWCAPARANEKYQENGRKNLSGTFFICSAYDVDVHCTLYIAIFDANINRKPPRGFNYYN